jgi:hypothetical protein
MNFYYLRKVIQVIYCKFSVLLTSLENKNYAQNLSLMMS